MGVIYQIVIAGGSRTYIGSAHRLPYRRSAHLCLLRKGTHHSRALQNAFNKYGESAVSWIILETVNERSKLIEREQTWLDKFVGKLYNKSPTAASRLGCTMSDEACAKISKSLIGNQYRKGIPFPPEHRAIISLAVKNSYATGRRKPTPQPQNLSAYNTAIQTGAIKHPSKKPEQDAAIVAAFNAGMKLKEIGEKFNMTTSAAGYAIRRVLKTPKGKWSKRCTR